MDGALVLLLLLMLSNNNGLQWGTGWTWPIPDLLTAEGVLRAEISQEFRRTGHRHLGVDLMYRRGKGWLVPEGTPALAARDGQVTRVDRTARGVGVVVRHDDHWQTFYQHLASATVRVGDRVKAGDAMGVVGADPTDPQRLVHLHFAVWHDGWGDAASVDPAAAMAAWSRLQRDAGVA